MDNEKTRQSAKDAGYMELGGAKKDADCREVQVTGGVSRQLGCCNEFKPEDGAQQFRCGTCKYLIMKRGLARLMK